MKLNNQSVISICTVCNKTILPDEPTIPDDFGQPGAKQHLGCAILEKE